jgi:ectoine hydroxylase-related dioxygenase (phytanoyl-CoA dioxygenase family)
MRTELSDAQVASYRDNGFLVVEDFLDADELEEWRAAVTEAVADRGQVRFNDVVDSDDRSNYYEQVFVQRVNLWQTNRRVRDLMLDARLGGTAAALAGVDGLRIWHDQALFKPPYGNPTAFHLDTPYWSFHSADAISLWVALDDATPENGCLYYVPGSHRAATFDNVGIGDNIGALFDVYPEWRSVPAVACPVAAGGALFHNGLTFHGAGANMTPGWRRAMTCAYMPDGSVFNGIANVLHPDQLARLSVGDRLDDDERQPLVFPTLTQSVRGPA